MDHKIIDNENSVKHHLIVGVVSLGVIAILNMFYNLPWGNALARVSYTLLFLTLVIGPITRLKKPKKSSSPLSIWNWRRELGIWFALTALAHFLFIMNRSFIGWSIIKALGGVVGGGGFGLATFIGLIALTLAIILASTSSKKAFLFLGLDSWKWIQRFSYVIFYLVFSHVLYFQFFSSRAEPSLFGYVVIGMAIILITLQFSSFAKNVYEHRKEQT